jgi:WD40 repeat protein
LNTKYHLTIHRRFLLCIIGCLLVLTTSLFTDAQGDSSVDLETISASNLGRLELITSWKPDGELLSPGIHIPPTENTNLIIISNLPQHIEGIIDLNKLELGHIVNFPTETSIFYMAISNDGQYSIIGDVKTIGIWNIVTGVEIFKIIVPNEDSQINHVDLSHDNLLAYTTINSSKAVSQDTIHIYDIATGKEIATLQHPSAQLVIFSPSGNSLVSAGYDGSVRLWDLQTEKFQEVRQADNSRIFQLSFVNSDLLAIGISDDTHNRNILEYWNVKDKKQVQIGDARQYSEYLKDGIASIPLNNYSAFQLWSVNNDKDLALLQNEDFADLSVENNLLITLSYAETSPIINFHSLDTGKLLYTINKPHLTDALLSLDSKNLLLWGREGYIEVWGIRQK